MNGAILQKCDSVLKQDVLVDKSVPGAVVCIVKEDKIIYENACGYQQLIPEKIPMGTQSIFDLASLSKCFGTAIAVMQLVEQGKIKLDEPVDKYLKGYRNWHTESGKERKIRIRDLLTHTGGLASYINVDSLSAIWGEGQADSLKNYIIKDLPRKNAAGEKMIYSCPKRRISTCIRRTAICFPASSACPYPAQRHSRSQRTARLSNSIYRKK